MSQNAAPLTAPSMKMTPLNLTSLIDTVLSVNDKSKPSLTHVLNEDEISRLLVTVRKEFLSQSVLLEIVPPMQVCGDIHGQYSDLIRIFSKIGWPPEKNFLFLGDYVDRGRQQLEVIILLFAYKCLYPEQFFMLRGNHECSRVNMKYGFYEEVKRRYSIRLFEKIQDVFNVMPLTALIGGRIFCMHGGLSPEIKSWTDLRMIKRPLEIGHHGLSVDILWSDPKDDLQGWAKSRRGISYAFGADVVAEFCERMDIDLIARAHQVVLDGYEFFARKSLVTIFSAPRYCGEFDNSAASMNVSETMMCSFSVLKPAKPLAIRAPKTRTDRNGPSNGAAPRSSNH